MDTYLYPFKEQIIEYSHQENIYNYKIRSSLEEIKRIKNETAMVSLIFYDQSWWK